MKKILVATDFSNEAYNALYYVTRLFEKENCHFFLLNSYAEHAPLVRLKLAHETSGLADESMDRLDETYHKIHLDHSNDLHQFTTVSKGETLVESIKDATENFNIDLLVLGSKEGAGGSAIFKSTQLPEIVDEIKNCPILIVPEEAEIEDLKEIAFATDYARSYDAKTLNLFRYLANLTGARVCVVHVNEEERLSKAQQSNRNILQAYLMDIRHTIHWMPDFSTKSKVIKCFLEELNIGMLVMIRYEHKLIPRIFREAVIKKIASELNIPFLILPEGG